ALPRGGAARSRARYGAHPSDPGAPGPPGAPGRGRSALRGAGEKAVEPPRGGAYGGAGSAEVPAATGAPRYGTGTGTSRDRGTTRLRIAAARRSATSTRTVAHPPRTRSAMTNAMPEPKPDNRTETITLRMPSRLELLGVLDRVADVLCERLDFDDDARSQVTMSVIEAGTNAIQHGHHRDASKPVDVEFHVLPDILEIIVHDSGPG